ncbi:hypothetical protein IEO21_09297 [Rhodonia placenta]|uniref:Uncharacterized protein n=1 Tax=Rhodonia placenta TaxID=104341 RepID=A0A8H7NUR2_9APHY|nr:hypothetical protein IEO21_09297 [Postia placenta]
MCTGTNINSVYLPSRHRLGVGPCSFSRLQDLRQLVVCHPERSSSLEREYCPCSRDRPLGTRYSPRYRRQYGAEKLMVPIAGIKALKRQWTQSCYPIYNGSSAR